MASLPDLSRLVLRPVDEVPEPAPAARQVLDLGARIVGAGEQP